MSVITTAFATSYAWNNALEPTSVVAPNQETASAAYDVGRPSQTTSPDGALTTYAYNGNQITATIAYIGPATPTTSRAAPRPSPCPTAA